MMIAAIEQHPNSTNEFAPAFPLNLSAVKFTPAQFQDLCDTNRDLRLELTSTGELIFLAPTGWGTSRRNLKFIVQIGIWNEQTQLGMAFESSGGFVLPNGAQRSPDVAWVEKSRIEAFNPDPNKFLPLAPDFLIELRSASDRLSTIQEKMQEYQANGVRLGWLIDPQHQRVEIYRINKETEILQSPAQLSGEDILPEFILDLTDIW
ncbi:Uma2 family endonuclease [Chamaesiphon sp. VAR_69_metabat_338]|uniref:Uma2 family endonuclease n=1 Tax=Chamaesiphon sp. VAR_69_metabat_338 TaxID=2964704 RepID=UPI00286D7B8A|nr:Uma2 family endonuclease [Chamaesiphon sp. VAR_69_metabat_338]